VNKPKASIKTTMGWADVHWRKLERQLFKLQNRIYGKSKPTRRVWIPKPNSTEKRPLGIPTVHDRALQALAKLALEPEWEAKFEPNSHGFRPGRGCHDAIEQIFLELKNAPKYILDADIAKCFDKINHDALLRKVNTYPTMQRQIKAWIKAGVMDGDLFVETESGTPQGGVISPLLANIALHGMEEYVNSATGYKTRWRQAHLIRYADDFIILHKDLEVIEKCKEAITQWLKPIGLELKPSKTRICHTLHEHNGEKAGFDFLGFNIRHYPCTKGRALRVNGKSIGITLTIKPSKEKVKEHLLDLRRVVKALSAAPQIALIERLSPIIRGWSNYYSTTASKETFTKCDYTLWHMLGGWAKRRHANKNRHWVRNKYWHRDKTRTVFSIHEGYKLLMHSDTPIRRFVKVQGNRSPYDGDWVYWSQRSGKSPLVSTRVATLPRRQQGKCAYCGTYFTPDDLMEVDHIIPKSKGGKDRLDNLQLLHRHCHDLKTAKDGSLERDVPMTKAVQERSRMKGNFHVRFCSEGGVSHRRVVVATQRFSLTE